MEAKKYEISYPIYEITDAVGDKNLINKCLSEAMIMRDKNISPQPESNIGCYRSTININSQTVFKKIIDQVIGASKKCIVDYLGHDGEISVEAWLNVNSVGSKNVSHVHSEADMVGCYYLQASGTGPLVIENWPSVVGILKAWDRACTDLIFEPEDNSIIMFPAYMKHRVDENMSNKDRVNIAFNINKA